MPYIKLKTNMGIDDKDNLKSLFGNVITIIPNKEEWMTMISIEDRLDLFLSGKDDPCAVVETLVDKGTDQSRNSEYCSAVVDMLANGFGLPRNRIYVIVQEQDFWFCSKHVQDS